jgi:hypothetical protein
MRRVSDKFRWLRAHRRWLTLLALPALLFRALVPAGFMPLVDATGSMTLGFCPGWVPAHAEHHAAHADHADHAGHHAEHAQHDHGSGSDDPAGAHHHAPCLFAASAGGAPAPALHDLGISRSPPRIRLSRAGAVAAALPTIVRAQWSRGPPINS